ncbi:Hypothetical protein SMAX5B_022527 [Scophthalmus maximus]|uniref:Uncharacterized protein n=1 Tax=Scophthalmus maximus TaxID=52904 RepID=A0A2U9C220_SCOMX|nr:Hypothetical protein SMAX5B_022527 [Scophthalmus maximus]
MCSSCPGLVNGSQALFGLAVIASGGRRQSASESFPPRCICRPLALTAVRSEGHLTGTAAFEKGRAVPLSQHTLVTHISGLAGSSDAVPPGAGSAASLRRAWTLGEDGTVLIRSRPGDHGPGLLGLMSSRGIRERCRESSPSARCRADTHPETERVSTARSEREGNQNETAALEIERDSFIAGRKNESRKC